MQSNQTIQFQAKTNSDREIYLSELQQFRAYPSSIVSYLKTRCSRYKKFQDSLYLISHQQRKKVIQMHETEIEANTKDFVNRLLSQRISLPKLTMIPKLNEIAMKLCLTIQPQMCNEIKYKPQSSVILREVLEEDKKYFYPNEVLSLVSLSFNQPYQPLATLLVDDGLPNRPNRSILLDPKYRFGGFASIKCKSDPELRCTVYIFAEQVIQKQAQMPSNPKVTQSNIRIQNNVNSETISNGRNSEKYLYEQNYRNPSQSAYLQQKWKDSNIYMGQKSEASFQKVEGLFNKKQLSQQNSIYVANNNSNAVLQRESSQKLQNYGPY